MNRTTLMSALLALTSISWAAETATIATYDGGDAFVHETSTGWWYALNDRGSYERWGVVEEVTHLSAATTYEGKYARRGLSIYRYAHGLWVPQDIDVTLQEAPSDGVYMVDGGGNIVAMDAWDPSSHASGVAVVSGGGGFVLSPTVVALDRPLLASATSSRIEHRTTVAAATATKDGALSSDILSDVLGGMAPAVAACRSHRFLSGQTGHLMSAGEAALAFGTHGWTVEAAMSMADGWGAGDWDAVATSTMCTATSMWQCNGDGTLSCRDISEPCSVIPVAPLPSVCFEYPYADAPDEGMTTGGIITFADSVAHSVCVANWDTDGDGELSIAEAAAVTDIDWVFASKAMTSLDELVYFTGISIIYGESFIGNSKLATITIPVNVSTIGNSPFRSCPRLKAIRVDDGNSRFVSDGGVLLDRRRSTVLKCPQAKTGTYVMPHTTQSVSSNSFLGSKLSSIEIPASVTYIDLDAFSSCSSLSSMKVHWQTPLEPSSEIFASTKCANAVLYVPSGTSDAYRASETWGAFGSIVEYDDTDANSVAFTDKEVERVCLEHWDADGDGILSIGEAAAPTSLDGAFRGNTLISHFPELKYFTGLQSFGDSEFEGCILLEDISFPSQLSSIGALAFSGCTSLASFSIPQGLKKMGKGALNGTTSLKSLFAVSSNTSFYSRNGILYDRQMKNLVKYPSANDMKSYSGPLTLRSVGEDAFRDAVNLETVSLPAAVTKISGHAFHGCTSLLNAIIPASISFVGEYAFAGCSSLVTATLPSAMKSVNDGLFMGCTNLFAVNTKGQLKSVGVNAFNGTAIDTLMMSDMTTSIGDYAFAHCSQLKRACMPASVTSIGAGAFIDCDSLALVRLNESLASIGHHAFYKSSGNNSTTSIDNDSNTPLTKLLVEGLSPLEIVENTYSDYSDCTLYVREQVLNDYAEANVWKLFGRILPLYDGDVNLDGLLSVADIMSLVSYILDGGNGQYDVGTCPMQYDVNHDNAVSVADVTHIVNNILDN